MNSPWCHVNTPLFLINKNFVHRQELIEEIDGVRDDPAMDSDAKSRLRNQSCRIKGMMCTSLMQCCSLWCDILTDKCH